MVCINVYSRILDLTEAQLTVEALAAFNNIMTMEFSRCSTTKKNPAYEMTSVCTKYTKLGCLE
jgi:hypothetical protein